MGKYQFLQHAQWLSIAQRHNRKTKLPGTKLQSGDIKELAVVIWLVRLGALNI
jgi:hypothetical protein